MILTQTPLSRPQGWSYVGDRLLSAVVPYEETGWYDGQLWVKPPEVSPALLFDLGVGQACQCIQSREEGEGDGLKDGTGGAFLDGFGGGEQLGFEQKEALHFVCARSACRCRYTWGARDLYAHSEQSLVLLHAHEGDADEVHRSIGGGQILARDRLLGAYKVRGGG